MTRKRPREFLIILPVELAQKLRDKKAALMKNPVGFYYTPTFTQILTRGVELALAEIEEMEAKRK